MHDVNAAVCVWNLVVHVVEVQYAALVDIVTAAGRWWHEAWYYGGCPPISMAGLFGEVGGWPNYFYTIQELRFHALSAEWYINLQPAELCMCVCWVLLVQYNTGYCTVPTKKVNDKVRIQYFGSCVRPPATTVTHGYPCTVRGAFLLSCIPWGHCACVSFCSVGDCF